MKKNPSKTIIIATDRPKMMREQLDKVLNELHHLEDINEYKNNIIGKTINKFQGIKIVYRG